MRYVLVICFIFSFQNTKKGDFLVFPDKTFQYVNLEHIRILRKSEWQLKPQALAPPYFLFKYTKNNHFQPEKEPLTYFEIIILRFFKKVKIKM